MKTGLDDRREKTRIDLKTTAKLYQNKQCHHLRMINISLHGAGLLSTEEMITADNAYLEISIPSYDTATTLKLNGIINHQTKVRNQYLIGFEFNQPTVHDSLVINEYFNFHQRYSS